ncbi:flavin monoamine oxidase family protein [Pseudoteredinibacter isoporae]|uniref:Tryptophan 2-monooxygenase n=1 Tax=Pseudoteredinibacter isoporae TaxID=570281 RepID=A0A7X0MVA3_9GAMM|nr:NAD(P)/FAD-dependent oxidoreductase [Pseudoteredinibacter isoporae]MBB6520875.1 monoamine oxidase [Pseudoteredinibacter isoporae]NHO86440.1 FAD-dependent oxidoreductase [Pseudoteredinibacter isoporae]NIB25108.1 FAD-dependent oxidoreductase [Pseudoteredinibacter isoporae]
MLLWPRAKCLLLAAFSLLSAVSWAQNLPAENPDKRDIAMQYDADVIVVGAGFAGLAAADELKNQGLSVLLLEARDRIGGRAHTVYDGEQAIEMGANWLHGQDNNPLVRLAEEQGIGLSPVTQWSGAVVYDEFGEQIEDAQSQLQRWDTVVEDYVEQYLEREPNASIQMLMDDAQKSGDLGFVSDELHSSFINFVFEQDWSADAADLSVQAAEDGKDYLGGDPMPLRGFRPMLQQLSKNIRVRLGHQVVALEQSANAVDVIVNHQGQEQTLRTKRALLTVPVSILQAGNIRFNPQLSARKREAINVIGIGQLNKVWLKFPEVFWDDNHAILRVSPEKGRFSLWVNIHAISGEPYLLALSTAANLEAGSDAEIVEEAMLGLRGIYGDDIPEPSKNYISRWHNDPFSMGAYSYLRQGGRPEHRDILAEPEGRIHFAGEASHRDFPSTVHGAYLSGLREAAKITVELKPFSESKTPAEQEAKKENQE